MSYIISSHAIDRWSEYMPTGNLREELKQGILYGGQKGDDYLLLLPCGYVAVSTKNKVIKTVLKKEHAIANMQSNGSLDNKGLVPESAQIVPEPVKRNRKVNEEGIRHSDQAIIEIIRHDIKQGNTGKSDKNLKKLGIQVNSFEYRAYKIAMEAAREMKDVLVYKEKRKKEKFAENCRKYQEKLLQDEVKHLEPANETSN